MAGRAAPRLALAALVSGALAGPAAAGSLALDEALARARAASPALRAAAADLEAAQGRLRQARLLPANPVLSGDLARHTEPHLPSDIDAASSSSRRSRWAASAGSASRPPSTT